MEIIDSRAIFWTCTFLNVGRKELIHVKPDNLPKGIQEDYFLLNLGCICSPRGMQASGSAAHCALPQYACRQHLPTPVDYHHAPAECLDSAPGIQSSGFR